MATLRFVTLAVDLCSGKQTPVCSMDQVALSDLMSSQEP